MTLTQLSQIHTSVLVFATSIESDKMARFICRGLMKIEGITLATVDLDDWEKVLRVECKPETDAERITEYVVQWGIHCTELLD